MLKVRNQSQNGQFVFKGLCNFETPNWVTL
jgi:hypothetical protein